MSDPLLPPRRVDSVDELLSVLGGVEALIDLYDITSADELLAIAGCVESCAESEEVVADTWIHAAVARLVFDASRTIKPPPPPPPPLDRRDFLPLRGHLGALEYVSATLRGGV